MLVTSLSSGSSGNCYLVQSGQTSVLIDCGLSASTLQKYLRMHGLEVEQLSGIFLTHEHGDHIKGAGTVSRKYGVPVFTNQRTLEQALPRWQTYQQLATTRAAQGVADPVKPVPFHYYEMKTGSVQSFGGLEVASFPVSHDGIETVCYTFKDEQMQGSILTDLGCATPEIYEPLRNSALIILEANHDRDKLQNNRHYPSSLKARIAGLHGHLSNLQAAQILRRTIETSGTNRTVWLAHLSQQNNTPALAVETITQHLQQAGIHKFPLAVAQRDRPSLSFDSATSFYQTTMF